jgi:hypothetical protein
LTSQQLTSVIRSQWKDYRQKIKSSVVSAEDRNYGRKEKKGKA